MRYIRFFGAASAVSSLVAGAFMGCANGNGDQLTLIEASTDGMSTVDGGGKDVTIIIPHDSGKDTTMNDDFIVIGFDGPGKDSPGFDAGHHDGSSSFDAGPSYFGPPGSECPKLGLVQQQACGKCGKQTSACMLAPDGAVPIIPDTGAPDVGTPSDAGPTTDAAVSDATTDATTDATRPDAQPLTDAGGTHDAAKPVDGGPLLIWGPFSACTGENMSGCVPGTTTVQSCGLCGTQMTVCEPDCELGTTNCAGQVLDGCAPGSIDFQPVASCSDASLQGQQRVCNSTCAWDASAACQPPPTTLVISPTVSGKVGTFVNFVASQQQVLLTTSTEQQCPTTLISGTNTPYGYVTLTNSSMTQNATVSVWTSQVAGAPQIDTYITAYTTMPTNMTSLEHCGVGSPPAGVVTDTCDDNSDPTACIGGNGTYGGLMIGDENAVTIPPAGSVVILVQDHFNDAMDIGVIAVTARTESFQ